MQTRQRDPELLLPLTPAVFHILLSLVGGDHHGYGIMQEVNSYTQGKLRLGPGTLYRSIKQMLAQGLIIEWDERPDPALDDQRRRYRDEAHILDVFGPDRQLHRRDIFAVVRDPHRFAHRCIAH